VTKRRIPVWPIVAVALFVFFAVIGTIYLALALALCVAIVMFGYWAWSKLPALFSEGPDRADMREREKRQRELRARRRSGR
jgi:hypothetical protein